MIEKRFMWINVKCINSSMLRIMFSCESDPRRAPWNLGHFQVGTTFCGSFEVLKRIGWVAYRPTFPPSIGFNYVFHVSLLKGYVQDYYHIIDFSTLYIELVGEFQPKPLCILDQRLLTLYNWEIKQFKVKWRHFRLKEATWEMVN